MQALVSRLNSQTLEAINVKEICEDVQVSTTTFFNYFPTKAHAIGYRVQLWSIDTIYQMRQAQVAGKSALDTLRILFESTAKSEQETPGLMREIVVFQVNYHVQQKLDLKPLTPAEYAHHFPDRPDIVNIQADDISNMIGNTLNTAQQAGELDTDTNIEALTAILIGIFFITPTMIIKNNTSLKDVYHRQLDILFKR